MVCSSTVHFCICLSTSRVRTHFLITACLLFGSPAVWVSWSTGSELGVLKWRFQSRDESLVPLAINCWPSASGSESYVNIEYESGVDYDLQNVVIAIPLPHMSHAPTVNQASGKLQSRYVYVLLECQGYEPAGSKLYLLLMIVQLCGSHA